MKRKPRFFYFLLPLLLMPILAVGVLGWTNAFYEKQLPVYGTLPSFSLVERTGKQISERDLDRKVWVASFLFTRCSEQCPRIGAKVKTIQGKLRFKENFRLVSISVDPKRDTPEALAAYAQRFDADPYKWLFLTGDEGEVQRLLLNGFRLTSEAQGGDIIHSDKLVLVDSMRRIRGYYDSNNDTEVRALIKDARKLIRQVF